MNTAKNIVSWALLASGIIIIIWSLLSTYNIFTGKIDPPKIFENQISEVFTKETSKDQLTDVQDQIEKAMQQQLRGLVPPDSFPKIFNMAAWSVLAWIFISGGAQISNLGIKLMNKG